nr:hypothetical protein [Tanacetum cinerariifolium]
ARELLPAQSRAPQRDVQPVGVFEQRDDFGHWRVVEVEVPARPGRVQGRIDGAFGERRTAASSWRSGSRASRRAALARGARRRGWRSSSRPQPARARSGGAATTLYLPRSAPA